MARLQIITVNVDDILRRADAVGSLGGAKLGQITVEVLNEVAARTYELSANRITTGVNLSDDYVRRRVELQPATASRPEAALVATGDRSFMTRLATYDARMVIVPRTSKRASRGKGLLAIPAGSKQQGVNVEVLRGNQKTLQSGWLMPLRAGNALGEKFGVFRRENGKAKHLYGPSVYQLFAHQAPAVAEDATDDLQQTLLTKVGQAVDQLLA